MELLQGFMQPPKAQSVDETIPTLCDRVENATLIGDRRSAILGLKSFSREYRETVVALGLKPLLNTLRRDFVDEASVKAILETLLILFIRGDGTNDLTRSWISQQSRLQNGKYPSPLLMKQEMENVDQFSLWIADAITQSEETVHLLIQLSETGNFHVRLYTVQILEALVATRPTKARNSIISLPTGISTLVSLLNDIHETVRDEIILLLMAVVNNSSHVQGLVAFENIFERLFSIIDEEGGLRGSIVVNDCLSLIHNILKYNTSNQTLFLETGNLPQLAHILNEPLQEESFFWNDQRIININTALDIVTLMVEPGTTKTEKHQNVLLDSNVLMIVLRLVFYPNIPKRVRPIAILAVADMIRGNEISQTELSKIDVPFFDPSLPSDLVELHNNENGLISVVDLLINWALYANSVHTFPTRMAVVELLKSYLKGNQEQQLKFLQQQISSYCNNGSDETIESSNDIKCNLFEALLDYDPDLKLNPYKLYFTTDIFMYLFQSDNEGNESLRELTRHTSTGNVHDDEESLSSIQTLSELLITSLSSDDVRIPISYITFLIFWLYGDLDATNDFLSSKPTIQSLLSFSYQVESEDDMTVKCLVTILLGVSYEFSSKHSPFPRKDYLEFITKTLGEDNYLSRIKQFKAESLFSKAETNGNILDPEFDETGLPQVYFSSSFVSFFLDNYFRIRSALKHSPNEEPRTKFSFEIFEEVQNQCSNLREELESHDATSRSKLESLQDELNVLTEKHSSVLDDYESLQKRYSSIDYMFQQSSKDLDTAKHSIKQFTEEREQLYKSKELSSRDIDEKSAELAKTQQKLEALGKELKAVNNEKSKAESGINKMNRELLSLTKKNEELRNESKQIENDKGKQIQELQRKEKQLEALVHTKEASLSSLLAQLEGMKSISEKDKAKFSKELNEWKSKFQSHDSLVSNLTEKLKSLAASYKDVQTQREGLDTKLSAMTISSNGEITKLQQSLEDYKSANIQLTSQNNKLSDEVQEFQQTQAQEVLEYQGKLSSTLKDLEISTKTSNDLRIQLDHFKAKEVKHEAMVKSMQQTCDDMQKRIHNYEKDLPELKSRCEELAEQLQNSKDTNTTLQEEKVNIKTQFDELQDTHKVVSARLAHLTEQVEKNSNSHTVTTKGLENTIKELHKEIAELAAKNSTLQEELATLKTSFEIQTEKESQNLRDVKQKLEEDARSKDSEISSWKSSCIGLEKKVKTLADNLKEEEAIKRDFERQLVDIKRSNADSDAQNDKASHENHILEKLIQEKEQEIELLKKSAGSFSYELKEVKEESCAKVRTMEAEIGKLQAELTNKRVEFEKERKLLNEGSDLVTQEYSDKVSKLEESLTSKEQELYKKSKELEIAKGIVDKLKAGKKNFLESSEKEIGVLKQALKTQKKDLSDVSTKLQILNAERDDEVSVMRKQIVALEKALSDSIEDGSSLKEKLAETKKIAKTAESSVISMKQQMDTDVIELQNFKEQCNVSKRELNSLAIERDKLDHRFKEEKSKLLEDNEILKSKFMELEKGLEDKHILLSQRQELQSCLKAKEQEVSAAENTLAEVNETLSRIAKEKDLADLNIKSLKDKVESKEGQLLHLNTLMKEKDIELNVKEGLNDELTGSTKALEKELDLIKNKYQDLVQKLEQKTSSSELDDLMLLVTDLDKRNAKYRALLKNHGVEVSSDDDDDDGDDDDDDDSDNDGGDAANSDVN